MARKDKNEDRGPKIELQVGKAVLPPPRLKKVYRETVVPKLQEQFKYKSPMQMRKIEKIVINMGTGNGEKDPKHLDNSVRDLQLISGQKPVITVAKKAISNFKIREGMKIGCKVTLRGARALHFF